MNAVLLFQFSEAIDVAKDAESWGIKSFLVVTVLGLGYVIYKILHIWHDHLKKDREQKVKNEEQKAQEERDRKDKESKAEIEIMRKKEEAEVELKRQKFEYYREQSEYSKTRIDVLMNENKELNKRTIEALTQLVSTTNQALNRLTEEVKVGQSHIKGLTADMNRVADSYEDLAKATSS